MIAEIAQFVGRYFVLVIFGIVYIALASAVSPGAFHDASFADEIGGLHRIGLVSRPEDQAVA